MKFLLAKSTTSIAACINNFEEVMKEATGRTDQT
jgi:hypothetical protein